MQLAMIGVGQGGGKVLDTFLEYVPKRYRILFGQTRVKGHGIGADSELVSEDADDLQFLF